MRLFFRKVTLEVLESRRLLSAASNDPLLSQQYALTTTDAAEAWATTTGNATVIVAGIDTGVDYTHEDLYRNIWINQYEIPSSLKTKLKDVDADGIISFYDLNDALNASYVTDVNANGYIDAGDLLNPLIAGGWEDGINGKSGANDVYVDDIIGWDFAENDNDPFDDGTANGGHGTHTAGIIGAEGDNGVGISGVIQQVSIMALRIFTDTGRSVGSALIAQAIRYSADNQAAVSNNSWGGSVGRVGDQIYSAIAYAGTKGQTFVVAAGNSGGNLDSALVNSYPAEYDLDNIVVVAATNSTQTLASYSNYGNAAVDIAAPGDKVLSTLPGDEYGQLSGTSMAAPMVTGTIALMLANDSTLTSVQIKARLLNGADESTALANRTVSDGELNVNNAITSDDGVDIPDAVSTTPGRSAPSHRRRIFSPFAFHNYDERSWLRFAEFSANVPTAFVHV